MEYFRRDLRQRFKHETALLHRGMWDREVRRINDHVIEQQNIDIDDRGTFFLNAPPAHFLFDVRIAAISSCGVLLVSSATAQFRNHGC